MTNIIGRIWKEYIAVISIILLIIGIGTLTFGVLGLWFSDTLVDTFSFNEDVIAWSLYVLIIGFVFTIAGVFYLYDFIKNTRFLLKEIRTNKRSEFIKNHADLKNAARNLPSKYQDMLTEREKQFRIK